MLESILVSAAPLMVIIGMKKILKALGLGGLMTLRGGLNATQSVGGAMSQGLGGNGGRGSSKERSWWERTKETKEKVDRTAEKLGNAGKGMVSLMDAEHRKGIKRGRENARLAAISTDYVKSRAADYEEYRSRRELTVDPEFKADTQRKALEERKARSSRNYLFADGSKAIPLPAKSIDAASGRAINTEDPYHWVNYLPEHLRTRRYGNNGQMESDREYHRRLEAYGVALGFRDFEGNDTWSATQFLTAREIAKVEQGDYSPLERISTHKIPKAAVLQIEEAAGIDEQFRATYGRIRGGAKGDSVGMKALRTAAVGRTKYRDAVDATREHVLKHFGFGKGRASTGIVGLRSAHTELSFKMNSEEERRAAAERLTQRRGTTRDSSLNSEAVGAGTDGRGRHLSPETARQRAGGDISGG